MITDSVISDRRRSILDDDKDEDVTGRLAEIFDLGDTSIEAEALRRKRSENKAVKQHTFN